MITIYLFNPDLELSQVDPLNEGLKVEVNSHVRMFIEGLDLLPPIF